jgi:hypothetical protein
LSFAESAVRASFRRQFFFERSAVMGASSQIGSILGDLVYAVIHPSVTSLPMGFLVLVLAVLTVAALPEGARERMRLAGLTAFGLIVSLSLSWPVNWAAILR